MSEHGPECHTPSDPMAQRCVHERPDLHKLDGYRTLKDNPSLVAAIERMARVKIIFDDDEDDQEEKQMSFSWSQSGVSPEDAAKSLAEDKQVPTSIKAFVQSGITALEVRHGGDVKINAWANGHLHTGEEGNYDVTSVSVNVKKMEE